jgi:hypothetical protein
MRKLELEQSDGTYAQILAHRIPRKKLATLLCVEEKLTKE